MNTGFVEELRWRGLLQDIMPGTEELLAKEKVCGYIGFDPTADSLHIGSLTQIFTLMRLQKAGHKPIALIGGATGMIGDPSGKSAERNLLDETQLQKNVDGIERQLRKFLDFNSSTDGAELLNNYEWMKNYSFVNFIRDVGKHLTVNYMMAKDSVKNRLETGMSFTEFSYQLMQAYDFYYLHTHKKCKLQMGGSDQWGNITSGVELIRRKTASEAFGLTTQLVRKADGSKFGKTEGGNIWLDKNRTSAYKFFQYWINTSDEDAKNFIRIFTFLPKIEIESLITEHEKDSSKRILQNKLAEELTCLVHSKEEYHTALGASKVLFSGGLADFKQLDETTFLELFEGVPTIALSHEELKNAIPVVDLLSEKSNISPSKGEARKLIQGGGLSINKEKILSQDVLVNTSHLINNKYIIIQKGKKNYFLCLVN
jgi:tyrosyl-tRNA synthetase